MRILPPDPGLLIVSCDGAARGNPGPAGIGVQITDEGGNVLAEIAEWIGETTNNVAEYSAALEGLRKAADLGARRVHLRSDSKLLIEQLAGRYKVKASHLRPLHAEVLGIMSGFERVRLQHVPREQNREADRLANLGVDLRGSGSANR
jgi:ribonuclease HI